MRTPPLVLGLLPALLCAGCFSFQQGPVVYPGESCSFVEVQGLTVHYRELAPTAPAAGPALVFLHGFGGGLLSWAAIQPDLARHHRTIAMDLKGFGRTSKPAGDYSRAAQADLVVALLDRLAVPTATLVAHSWGSSVALEVARRHPQRVAKLVLVAGFVYEEQLNGFLRWSQLPVLGEVLFGLAYDQGLEARYTWGFYDPARFVRAEHFDHLRAFQQTPGVTAAALATVRGMGLAELGPSLSTITQPALLVWGAADRVSPPRWGARLAADLPAARLHTLARAGHHPMLERAGTLVGLIEEFLQP